MRFPRFTDLRGIAQELEGDPRYRRLAATIERALRAQSCVADLEQSGTVVQALDELVISPRRQGTLTRGATENALLMNAVLLYARATSTGGGRGERGPIDISPKLDDAQKSEHVALLNLRNRALAHVYPNERVADDIWHSNLFFLVETPQGWKPGAASRTYQFHKPTLEKLRRQIPVAHKIVKDVFHKHVDQLSHLMNSCPVPFEVFLRNAFDPVTRFGDERTVVEALSGIDRGHASVLS